MILIVDMKISISYNVYASLLLHLRTKFHIPRSSDSLVITVKPKAIENVRTTPMLFFYIQQKYYLKTGFVFSKTFPYFISGHQRLPYSQRLHVIIAKL